MAETGSKEAGGGVGGAGVGGGRITLAIVGATVRTLDPALPHAEAVALRDGTIVAVGDDAAVRAHCDGAPS